jgi:aspartokinase
MTLDSLSNGYYPGSITPNGPASSGCVVQKFGGTSVGKFALEIVTNVIRPSLIKDYVAVVCSAISATVKADGTTNRWVSAFSILEMSPI